MKLDSVRKNWDLLLFSILTLFSPAAIGFQYLEWHDSNHLFVGIIGSIWAISYSDWYLNDWQMSFVPNIFVFIPRLLFTIALIGNTRGIVGMSLVRTLGLILAGIMIFLCFTMMTANSIFGIPPGVLISIAKPDNDVRLFVPTPILILAGIHWIRKMK